MYINVKDAHSITDANFPYSQSLAPRRHYAGIIIPSDACMPRHVSPLPASLLSRMYMFSARRECAILTSTFSVLTLPNITNKPIHTLLHTPTIHRTTRNDTPIPIFQLSQLERFANLTRALCARLILLVGENKERGVAEFFFVEHGAEFFGRGGQALDVGRVDDEYYGGGVGVVTAPVRADGRLASEVLG